MVGIILFVAHGFRKRAAAFFLPKTDHHARRVFLVNSSPKNRKRFVLPPKTTTTKRLVLPSKKVAKLTAPRSQFGWVFFDEPPAQKADKKEVQTGIPTTTDGDVLTIKRAQATEEAPKKMEATHTKLVKKVAKQAETAETSLVSFDKLPPTPRLRRAGRTSGLNTQKAPVKTAAKQMEEKPLELVKKDDKAAEKPIEVANKTEDNKTSATVTAETKQMAKAPTATKQLAAPTNTPGPKPVEAKADEPPANELNVEDRIERIKSIQAAITGGGRMPAPVTTPQAESPSQDGKLGPTTTIAQDGQAEGANAPHIRGAAQHEGKAMPKRNIIALTKGFIEKWDGEDGTDLVDRDGDPSIKASLEEMRALSYESKITWCLQAAWKQNFCYRSTRQLPEGDAIIEFTIDEHGNVTNSVLLQSSGHAELDAAIMKTTKYANPFPPLPQHLGTKLYTTGRIIQVRSHRYSF
jgi:TonB family protein